MFVNGWRTTAGDVVFPSFYDAFPIARNNPFFNVQDIPLHYHWLNNSRMITNGTQTTSGRNTFHTFSTRVRERGYQNDQLIIELRRPFTVSWNVLSILIGSAVVVAIILILHFVKKEKSKPKAEDFFPYDPNV